MTMTDDEERRWRVTDADRGRLYRELWRKRHASYESLFWPYLLDDLGGARRNRGELSHDAARLVHGAYRELTGMQMGCNRYYLADAMSEAIEAAEALGL